jgi:hypothetical protein
VSSASAVVEPLKSAPRRVPFPPVVAILAAFAFLDLVCNRVVGKLLHFDFLQPRSPLTRAIDLTGLFAYELTAVLAVLTLLAGLARIVVAGAEFRIGARVSFPLVGAVFIALASLGVLGLRLPGALVFHLHLSFLFLSLLLMLAVLASHADAGVKLGATLLVLAIALRVVPQAALRMRAIGPLLPVHVEAIADGMLATIGVAGLCLLPRRGSALLAHVITWPVVAAAVLLIWRDWDTAARVAAYGFGIELPLTTWGQVLVIGALASGLFATVRLLSVPGVHRLRGWGFALLMLSGLELAAPHQLALAALGLLCIAESAVRLDGASLSREQFEQLVRRAAASLGAREVTLVGEHGWEVARVTAGEARTHVRIDRRAGAIVNVEATVGEAVPRDPPFVVERRGAGARGPHSSGARVATEDTAFDREFDVYDARGAGAALLDDATRARMLALVHGWLGVWPQRGVRYRATAVSDENDFVALLTLLRELADRTK